MSDISGREILAVALAAVMTFITIFMGLSL